MNFSTIDTVIVVVYLLGSVAIGLWSRRFVHDMSDFTVAGRSLRSRLGVATMIGTELGLVTLMFMAQMGVNGGLATLHIALLGGVVTLVIGWTGFIVVPLRREGVMTIPEYYEKRFGRNVRVFGGIVLALAGILNMGMFLKAGAIFLTSVTGLDDDFYVKAVMTALLALVLFYTMLGGMISIIVTDYVQFVVLSIGLIVTCILAFAETGWTQIVEIVQNVETVKKPAGEAAVNPFHINEKGRGFGGEYVVWQAFLAMVSCAIWQTAVMRACSASDTDTVKRIYKWSSIGFLIRCLVPIFLGICALAYFAQDPETSKTFLPATEKVNPNYGTDSMRAMPVFLGEILPVGVLGLVTAGMLAAFMSTHDSYLLCWSSVLTQDVVAPLCENGLSNRTRLNLTRMFIFAIGFFLLVWGLWYPLGQSLWDYMAITGAIYFTGAFALLVGGLYTRIGSQTGALLALSCGALAVLGLTPVKVYLGIEWSGARIGLAVIAGAVAAYVIGSLLVPDRPKKSGAEEED